MGYALVGASREATDAGSGEVWSFYVHPDYWGGGANGASRLLIERALAHLHGDEGYARVIVVTFEQNERSVPFYKKHGFVWEGFVEVREYLGHRHPIVILAHGP